jgi:hypothetical protein
VNDIERQIFFWRVIGRNSNYAQGAMTNRTTGRSSNPIHKTPIGFRYEKQLFLRRWLTEAKCDHSSQTNSHAKNLARAKMGMRS